MEEGKTAFVRRLCWKPNKKHQSKFLIAAARSQSDHCLLLSEDTHILVLACVCFNETDEGSVATTRDEEFDPFLFRIINLSDGQEGQPVLKRKPALHFVISWTGWSRDQPQLS